MLTRRSFITTSGLTAAVAACSPSTGSAGGLARFGYNGDFWGASIVALASEKKLWAKHGVDAEIKVFTNGPIQVQALGAGSLDFGYLGPGALWLPASGKAKIIAVNSVGFSDRVITRSGVRSMTDLKGKTVGVPFGTSGDMLLRLALRDAGMTVDDVQLIDMSPSTIVSAFVSGNIAAAGIWYPFVGIIREHAPDMIELAKNDDFFPATTFPSVFITRNDLAAHNPGLVRKVVAVIKEAQDLRAADLQGTLEATAKLIGVPVGQLATEADYGRRMTAAELVKLTKDGTVNGWFATLNDLFKTFGRFDKPLDPRAYYLGEMYASA
jgi:NitT/TauT family transport system substrate-binding protein